jgi:hypothetical protein
MRARWEKRMSILTTYLLDLNCRISHPLIYTQIHSSLLLLATFKGSFQSLHGGGYTASDYQNLLYYQNASATASHSPSAVHHQQQQQQQQQQYYASGIAQQHRQQLNSVTSSDSISGITRSRVNSDSNSKYSAKNSGSGGGGSSGKANSNNNNNNNPPLSSSEKKCANANGANNNNVINSSSVNSNRNVSNNPNSSSNNLSQATNSSNNNVNNNNNASSHLRQRHIIELNRQVSELNNKNIEFNRQLSAPAENQNSCNSVYNLYSNHILQNSQYHSGSPNTNSLNRTKKKRSFKLNGR